MWLLFSAAFIRHNHQIIIIIVIAFGPYWSIGCLQELSRHPYPWPASQVVPRCNPTSLFWLPGCSTRCVLDGLTFSCPGGSRSRLVMSLCGTGHWLSEGVSNPSLAWKISSCAGWCLVYFQRSLLLMVSGLWMWRILLRQVLKYVWIFFHVTPVVSHVSAPYSRTGFTVGVVGVKDPDFDVDGQVRWGPNVNLKEGCSRSADSHFYISISHPLFRHGIFPPISEFPPI